MQDFRIHISRGLRRDESKHELQVKSKSPFLWQGEKKKPAGDVLAYFLFNWISTKEYWALLYKSYLAS